MISKITVYSLLKTLNRMSVDSAMIFPFIKGSRMYILKFGAMALMLSVYGCASNTTTSPDFCANYDWNEFRDSESLVLNTEEIDQRYPKDALKYGIEGCVVLSFDISKEGTASNIKVLEESPVETFRISALEMAKQFRFKQNEPEIEKKLMLRYEIPTDKEESLRFIKMHRFE